jgi:Transcriptional regulator.
MDIASKIFLLFNDDPKIRIIKLLALNGDGQSYASFRTIAKRTGINYSKLKLYLEQLERAGIIKSVKIITNNRLRRGYSYYKLRGEIRHYIAKLVEKGSRH